VATNDRARIVQTAIGKRPRCTWPSRNPFRNIFTGSTAICWSHRLRGDYLWRPGTGNPIRYLRLTSDLSSGVRMKCFGNPTECIGVIRWG
jgi:hypothetical protein